jgi:DNA polymerase III sliding clamp (beta) subunit (PCNA family)
LTYLVPLGKVFSSIESVTIAFGENFPLAMDFTFSDGSGSVKYFLAPRVEQEGY